jgi:hypothetical protein
MRTRESFSLSWASRLQPGRLNCRAYLASSAGVKLAMTIFRTLIPIAGSF